MTERKGWASPWWLTRCLKLLQSSPLSPPCNVVASQPHLIKVSHEQIAVRWWHCSITAQSDKSECITTVEELNRVLSVLGGCWLVITAVWYRLHGSAQPNPVQNYKFFHFLALVVWTLVTVTLTTQRGWKAEHNLCPFQNSSQILKNVATMFW